jgi:hypothetical protein
MLTFLKTARRFLDGSDPNDPFSINAVNLGKDFGIERVF